MATPSGIIAGKAFVIIEAVDKTAAVMKKIGGGFKAMGAKFAQMGVRLIRLGAIGFAPFALGTKIFAEFDDVMRRVEARSSGTAQEMEALRNQAKMLGRTTSFTARQVGALQEKLAQKGFDRRQIQAMTGDLLNLAKAAGSGEEGDTVLAADVASGTLKAFKLDVADMKELTDLLTTATNESNFSLEELKVSLAEAAPVARQYGVSIRDTLGILMSMRDVNIDASKTGTTFRNLLLNMGKSSITGPFNKKLQALTGSTIAFADSAGNLRKPQQILFEIGEALKGLGTAEAGDLLGDLLGKRAFVGGAVIADGINVFGKFRDVLADVDGQAAKTAESMEAGIGGAFRRFLSAVEGVNIAVGESLAKALNKITDAISPVLTAFATWIENNQGLTATIAAVIAGVVALGGALLSAGIVLSIIGGALQGIGSMLSLVGLLAQGLVLAAPFIFAATAIAAVAFGLFKIIETIGEFNSTFKDNVKDATSGVASAFQGAFSGVVGFMQETFGKVRETFFSVWDGIKDAMAGGDLGLAAKIAWQGIVVAFLESTNNIRDMFGSFWAEIRKLQVTGIELIAKGMTILWGALEILWVGGTGNLKVAFLGLIEFIANAISTVMVPIFKAAADALELIGLAGQAKGLRGAGTAISTLGAAATRDRKKAEEDLAAGTAKIQDEGRVALKSLTDDAIKARKKIDEEARKGEKERDEALDRQKKKLKELRDEARKLAETAADLAGFTSPLLAGAGSGADIGLGIRAGRAPFVPTGPLQGIAIRGLEAGSVAAAEKFAANQQMKPLNDLVGLGGERNDLLAGIKTSIDKGGILDAESA